MDKHISVKFWFLMICGFLNILLAFVFFVSVLFFVNYFIDPIIFSSLLLCVYCLVVNFILNCMTY
ncbi:MAG TPA: hypothetical protein DCD96_07685 [Flavobacteriales bacterium]|nr:hypothetical protein [Flavobacteriales bacterium]